MAAVPPTSQPTIVKTSSAFPESEPPPPVISMTVALNNVGAVRIHIKQHCKLLLPCPIPFRFALCVLQNAPLKNNLSGIVSQVCLFVIIIFQKFTEDYNYVFLPLG